MAWTRRLAAAADDRAMTEDDPVRRGSASVRVAVAPGAWTVWRLSSAGRRIAPVPSSFDPATGTLSFVARTDFDPASATLCYELARD